MYKFISNFFKNYEHFKVPKLVNNYSFVKNNMNQVDMNLTKYIVSIDPNLYNTYERKDNDENY